MTQVGVEPTACGGGVTAKQQALRRRDALTEFGVALSADETLQARVAHDPDDSHQPIPADAAKMTRPAGRLAIITKIPVNMPMTAMACPAPLHRHGGRVPGLA